MSYATKNKRNVWGAIVAVMVVAAIAVWQFYRFVTFQNANGIVDSQGGTLHLLLAIVMSLFACISAFLLFSVFLRHDTDDELHITSPPPRRT